MGLSMADKMVDNKFRTEI